jgi:hypothetical protein
MTGSLPPIRRRGAPSGNTNALKHGFYSSRYRKVETRDLQNCKFTGLQDEIDLLRVYMRRVVENSPDTANLPELIELLRVLSLSAATITRLARTQKFLVGETNEVTEALNQALEELSHEIPILQREE